MEFSNESRDFRSILHAVPGELVQVHFHQHVAGEKLATGRTFFLVDRLDDLLGGNQDFAKMLVQSHALDVFEQRQASFVFETGVCVNHIPLLGNFLFLGLLSDGLLLERGRIRFKIAFGKRIRRNGRRRLFGLFHFVQRFLFLIQLVARHNKSPILR